MTQMKELTDKVLKHINICHKLHAVEVMKQWKKNLKCQKEQVRLLEDKKYNTWSDNYIG